MSNYELGVVVPLYDTKEANDIVCWERPPESYESQGDQPWVGLGFSTSRFPLLTFVHRFRANLPYSINWTGSREPCIRKFRVDPLPSPAYQVSNLPVTNADLQNYEKGKFNELNVELSGHGHMPVLDPANPLAPVGFISLVISFTPYPHLF